MNIVHVNTNDVQGGAARAAFRLHRALWALGCDSRLAAWKKTVDAPDVVDAKGALDPAEARGVNALQHQVNALLDAGKTNAPGSIFSGSLPGVDISGLEVLGRADAINLHWVARFLSPSSLGRIFRLGKPVVWRFADQWPMTGGCHHCGGCDGYMFDCSHCPQLIPRLAPLAKEVLTQKKTLFSMARVTLVSPSRWLAESASKSAVFKNQDIRIIPNGIDTGIFFPRRRAKHLLGIPPDTAALLFVAANAEKYKGFDGLTKALTRCQETFPDGTAPDGRRIVLLRLGEGASPIPGLAFPVIPLGLVHDDARLALIYSAADMYLMPSLQENFPSTALEAMACARPVIGSDVGGIPDIVVPGQTGLLVPANDPEAWAGAIASLVNDPARAAAMGERGRQRVLDRFSLALQAGRYAALYEELAARGAPAFPAAAVPPVHGPFAARVMLQALGQPGKEAGDKLGSRVIDAALARKDAGDFVQALELLRAHLEVVPEDVEILRTLGAVHAARGETHEAVACFERALALAPDALDLALNISDAWRYAGRHEEALAALGRIEETGLVLPGLWLKRGQALAAMGRPRPAISALAREYRLFGSSRALELIRHVFATRRVNGSAAAKESPCAA